MGRIYELAREERKGDLYQKMMVAVEGMTPGSPEWNAVLTQTLDDVFQHSEPAREKSDYWNFSEQKSQQVFAKGEGLLLRPIRADDEEFYFWVRQQYTNIYKTVYNEEPAIRRDAFESEVFRPESLFCIIEDEEGVPVGYLALKDTSAAMWELAIELDECRTQRGIGSQSVCLFLNEVHRLTGKDTIKACVEVDNIPSQHFFEKLGAKLTGLHGNTALRSDEEKKRFENRHLDLIDDNMRELAVRLGVDASKLLSHVLVYMLACPI